MTRQDHWNRVAEGEGEGEREGERVWELCDMVSINIIINILMYMIDNTNNLYYYNNFSKNE